MASSRNRKKEEPSPLMEEVFDTTDTGTPTISVAGSISEGGIAATTEKAMLGFPDEKEAVIPVENIPPVLRMERDPTKEEIDALVEMVQNAPPPVIIPSLDPEKEETPSSGSDESPSEDIYEELVRILSPQKGKRGVPTLVGFESTYARAKRYVIIDINDNLLNDAYRCWRDHDAGDDEAFLDMVYKITRTEVPRMYRTVAFLDLK